MYSDQELSDDLSQDGATGNLEYFMSIPEFVHAVNEGICRPGVDLFLHNSPEGDHDFEIMQPITLADLETLVDCLLSGNCPSRIRLIFGRLLLCPMNVNRDISLEEYRVVAYPLDVAGLQPILRLLESEHAPEAMCINLTLAGDMGPKGTALIAKSLAKGNGPRNLTLKIMETYIGLAGIKAFEEGLASGMYPEGFTLRLDAREDQFVLPEEKSAAFIALAHALRGGHCPKGFGLDFCINDADVVTALVGALNSRNCPVGLTLYIHSDRVLCHDFLKRLFESGAWPLGLRLKLIELAMSEASVHILEQIHNSEKCIPGLRIREFNYDSNAEDEESPENDFMRMTQTLLKQNDAWHIQNAHLAMKTCITFLLIWRVKENPLSALPSDVIYLILDKVIPWWKQAIPGHFKATGRISFFKHIERIASTERPPMIVSDEDTDFTANVRANY